MNIEQGIEILTGAAAGRKNGDGTFEKDTVFAMIDDRLSEMAKMMKEFE